MKNARNAGRLCAVLDTNVLISAYQFSHGPIAELRRALERGQYILIFSPAIANELADILRRRFGWNDMDTRGLVKFLSRKAILVQPKAIPDAVPNDPDDNQIIACALEGQADLIVSGDRDLLALREYEGIPLSDPWISYGW